MQKYIHNIIKTNIMHRLEKNILHHAKKQREQRKLKQRQKYLEFKYGTGNINSTYPYDW